MKNELKKGYRLTREEEAIMRGQTPQAVNPKTEPAVEPEIPAPEHNSDGKPKKSPGMAIKSILPLLIAFGLMISIAYLFLWLVNTPERRARQAGQEHPAMEQEAVYIVSEAERALYTEELRLTEEESPAFFRMYALFMQEMSRIRAEYTQWAETEAESDAPETVFEDEKERYLSVYEKLKETEGRYMEAIALLIGQERTVIFLRTYTRQNAENPVHMP